MLGAAIGIIVFFAVEAIYLNTFCDLEMGFLPSVGLAIVSGIAFEVWLLSMDEKQYNPAPMYYELPMPQVIAIVKRVVKTYYSGSRRWRLNYDDRQTGEIQASMVFMDDSYSEMRWLVPSGKVERIINLHAHVMTDDEGNTRVLFRWDVESPLTRAECNLIIQETTNLIHRELMNAQYQATATGS